jgi:hypothetical protein
MGSYMEAAYTVPMYAFQRWHYTVSSMGTIASALEMYYPPVSPTSGIPYAGSSRNRD